MASILNIGISIPAKRLRDDIYFKSTGFHINGERAIADYDEDSVTLACSAGLEATRGIDIQKIDRLLFASTTPVYAEKLNASLLASVLGCRDEIHTADITGSLRSMLTAVRICLETATKNTGLKLVLGGETRRAQPGSQEESTLGDAGAGVVISPEEDGFANIEACYSITRDILHTWRPSIEPAIHQGEQKFISENLFQTILTESIKKFLSDHNLAPSDINALVLPTLDGRSHRPVFRSTGIKSGEQETEELYNKIGFTGSPSTFILLAYMADKVRPGDRILLCAFGDGVELLLLRITREFSEVKKSILSLIGNTSYINDYYNYLKIAGLLQEEKLKSFTSIPVITRESKALLQLIGTKCKGCGTINYPPRRICWNCSEKDNMEDIKLKRTGRIYTYTKDYVFASPFPPTGMVVLDLDDGGRFYCQCVDSDKDKLKVGAEVELTLRRLHEGGDFVHYFWKARIK